MMLSCAVLGQEAWLTPVQFLPFEIEWRHFALIPMGGVTLTLAGGAMVS
jgi:hypothetical protein